MNQRKITYRNEQDREDFAKFVEFKVGFDKIGPKTQRKRLDSLLAVSRLVEKPLRDLTVEDLLKVQVAIVAGPWSPDTKYDRTRDLKQFVKWKHGEFSPEFKIIKTKKPGYKEFSEGELITEAELRALEEKASLRIATAIEIYYQLGLRPAEFCNLRVKDYLLDGPYLWFYVYGKKTDGSKRDLLIKDEFSINLFKKYLEFYKRVEPMAFLWINDLGTPLSTDSLRKAMKKLKEDAKFPKKFYPYWLRHSRASFLEGRISNRQFHRFFSWVPGSKMPARYVHGANEELKRQMDELYPTNGVEKNEQLTKELLEGLFDEKTLDFLLERAKEKKLLAKLKELGVRSCF